MISIFCIDYCAFQLYGGMQALTPLQLARLQVLVHPQRHGMPCIAELMLQFAVRGG